MRPLRIKPAGHEVFYHVYNRVAGSPGYLPFGDTEKDLFVTLLIRLCQLYTVEVIAFVVMSNHFHILLYVPAGLLPDEEVCKRYAAYHHFRRKLTPGSAACRETAAQLRDISCFMHDLQGQFSRWFNQSLDDPRRGPLWASRFKHTLLEGGLAVWDCWKYIEMNPVRAALVEDPAEYRFCSYGRWCAYGRHPFGENVKARILPHCRDLLNMHTVNSVRDGLRRHFLLFRSLKGQGEATETLLAVERGPLPFTTQTDRRVRYWVDGLVIGTRSFIAAVMTLTHLRPRSHAEADDESAPGVRLACYRRLYKTIGGRPPAPAQYV